MWLNNIKFFLPLGENPLGSYIGVALDKRETPIVVSLSSEREAFKNLPKTIYSLLTQELKPDKVILWLDEEYEDKLSLPYEITQFIKNGLEIRFVEDMKSYTKIFYSLKEFSDCIVVTANECVYYDKKWLKDLYLSYITFPNDIQACQVLEVNIKDDELFLTLPQKNSINSKYSNFGLNKHGILYPPNCFSKEVLRKDIFLKNSPSTDEAWLWVMALVNNRKIRLVKRSGMKMSKTIYKNIMESSLKNLLAFYKNNIFDRLK